VATRLTVPDEVERGDKLSESMHRQETVSIFIANLHAIFNDTLRKNHGTLLYCFSEALRQSVIGRVLNFSQTDGINE